MVSFCKLSCENVSDCPKQITQQQTQECVFNNNNNIFFKNLQKTTT